MDADDMMDNEMEDEVEDGVRTESRDHPHEGSTSRRACDPCRARKVGCDREEPCSNCVRSRTKCSYSTPLNTRHKKQRVLISTQYERKIDRIEERLSEVVSELRNLSTQQTPGPPSRDGRERAAAAGPKTGRESAAATPTSRSDSCYAATNADTEVKFEGESSMTAHTDFAKNFLEQAVRAGPLEQFSPELDETLTALRNIVKAQRQQTAPSERFLPETKLLNPNLVNERPLPDVQLTMTCLQISKESTYSGYLSLCGVVSIASFTDYVLKVLFSPKFSDAEYIIVLCGLTWVFREISFELDLDEGRADPNLPREDLEREEKNCRENLEMALSRLPFHLSSSVDNIIALGLASDYAVGASKPSLAWNYICSAAQMCLNLGLHRNTTRDDSTKGASPWLFWSIYALERGLSLRLGRPSSIQDYDITVPMPFANLDDHDPIEFTDHWLTFWVRLARVEGRVYELLYSPGALAQDDESRTRRAEALASEVLENLERKKKIQELNFPVWQTTVEKEDIEFVVASDDVLYYSILTLIYRAIPAQKGSKSTFTPACVAAARTALQKHDGCMAMLRPYGPLLVNLYIQWTILYTPFIPFIVVFCHVIETTDPGTDLEQLHSFVASMDPAMQLSESATRMQHLFQVLYNVALKYLEVKMSREQLSVGREFDTYLNALGYGPGPGPLIGQADGTTTTTTTTNSSSSSNNGAAAGVFGHMTGGDVPGTGALLPAGVPHTSASATPSLQSPPGHAHTWTSFQAADAAVMPPQGMVLGEWFYSNRQMMGLMDDEAL